MSYFSLSFAKRKYLINATKFWTVFAVLMVLLLLDIAWLVHRAKTLNTHIWATLSPLALIISVAMLLAAALVVVWILLQVDKRLEAKMEDYISNYEMARKGDDGEGLVLKNLQQWLSADNYKIFPNVTIPGVRSDFDFVIVGLKGVILLEVKNYDTKTVFTYNKALYRSKEGQLVKQKTDIREVVNWRAEKLEKYLAEQGLNNIKVHKVVVFVNPESVSMQGNWENKYKVFVAKGIPALGNYLSNLYTNKVFTADYTSKVCAVLNKK